MSAYRKKKKKCSHGTIYIYIQQLFNTFKLKYDINTKQITIEDSPTMPYVHMYVYNDPKIARLSAFKKKCNICICYESTTDGQYKYNAYFEMRLGLKKIRRTFDSNSKIKKNTQ